MGAPGCDDAPLVEIQNAPGSGKRVTMIYPFYCNAGFLARQIEGWWRWSEHIRDMVQLIIVDDCSPERPAADVLKAISPPFPTRLFRVDVDKRWGWPIARNVGAHHADEGWLLLTDMDHVVPQTSMVTLMRGEHDPGIIYRFSRTERGQKIHPHPNSWFMTRAMFWKIGGYDERTVGFYGSDSIYRRRCAATAPIRIMSNVVLRRHEHEGDSSTTRYLRKQPQDAALRPLVRSFPLGSKPLTLSFPYREEPL